MPAAAATDPAAVSRRRFLGASGGLAASVFLPRRELRGGLAQEIRKAIRALGNARPDGRILWDLTGRKGLFQAANLRKEIAEAIPAFASMKPGALGDHGVLLNGHA